MYKKMVVLLDGSELAEVAFAYAKKSREECTLTWICYTCVARTDSPGCPCAGVHEQKTAQLCAEAEAVRKKDDKDATAQCILAQGRVVVGHPPRKSSSTSTKTISICNDVHDGSSG